MRRLFFATLLAFGAELPRADLRAEPVPVRHTEGVVHGFLALRTLEGKTLADGELIQFAQGDRVTSRVVFQFRDGSVHDESAVFLHRGAFRLVSDCLLQKGPSFPKPMEVRTDAESGRVTVRYWKKDGKEELKEKRLELPTDVDNGLVLTLVKNLRPDSGGTTVSMVAATTSPLFILKVVKLRISKAGAELFSIGSVSHKATRYVVKVEIGGFAGLLASLVGKKPADTQVWILGGPAPAFVKSEGPLFLGGPIWRIELTHPTWRATKSGTVSHSRRRSIAGTVPLFVETGLA